MILNNIVFFVNVSVIFHIKTGVDLIKICKYDFIYLLIPYSYQSIKAKSVNLTIKSDLTKNLQKLIKDKNVSVFIDAGNLYHAASKSSIKLDFLQIASWFKNKSKKASLNFYTAFNPDNKLQLEFLENLQQAGYNICKKPIKIFENLSKKGNMDVELAVDAIDKAKSYDVFVLFSGDGDFHYLVKYLENMGKTSIILSLGGFTSYELHQDADNYFFLNRISNVWKRPKNTVVNKDLEIQSKEYVVFIDQLADNEEKPFKKKKIKNKKKPLQKGNISKGNNLKVKIKI